MRPGVSGDVSGRPAKPRRGSRRWRLWPGRTSAALLAALLVLVSAAPATATGAAEISVRFTTKTAGAPSGLGVHLLLRDAADPSAKPPPLRSATVQAPDGVSFDTAALPRCSASDTDLQLFGSNACPADTRLATGTLVGITGFGPPVDPLTGEDHVFNGPSHLIEVITAPGTPLSPAFDRLRISGSTLTAHPPSVPGGPPEGKTSIRSIDFQIPLRTAGGRSLITTPPVCPVDHEWTTHATFYFDDGSVASAVSHVPCSPTPAGSQPRVSLIAFPHVVKEGQPVQVRFRVSSQGATARLA